MPRPLSDAQLVEVKTREALQNWLAENHAQKSGVWLVTYKKGTEHYIRYDAIVEECLCFGWVDSLPRKLDAERSMLYIAPRKAGSNWSGPNKERIERLQKKGLLYPAGMAKVEAAKKDGSWSFLDDVEAGILPDDLEQALSENPTAAKYFDEFPRSVKRGILEWIKNAKRDKTRAKRIELFLERRRMNAPTLTNGKNRELYAGFFSLDHASRTSCAR